MVPGDMYEWSRVIFAKKSKFHDAGGPDTVVSPSVPRQLQSGVRNVVVDNLSLSLSLSLAGAVRLVNSFNTVHALSSE